MKKIRLKIFSALLSLAMLVSMLSGCADGTAGGAGDLGGSGIGGDNGDESAKKLSFREGESVNIKVGNQIMLHLVTEGLVEEVEWHSIGNSIELKDGVVKAVKVGIAFVTVSADGLSASITVHVVEKSDEGGSDNGGGGDSDGGTALTNPYLEISKEEFYANYRPAAGLLDSKFRTECGYMSGSIEPQDQAPTEAENKPTSGGKLIKNSAMIYGDGGDSYKVVDSEGRVAFVIYRGGAYVTLEEVAAYVFAFGTIPANYVASKKTSPTSSKWGEYLRLNHSEFTGNTSKYPYEPKLPRIGDTLSYYEIDIGTTGTDCDPAYISKVYNDGVSITRGAARIVYARFTKSGSPVTGVNDKYVFYTYNHYNDFQEYLNYFGGWGIMFGNITGGGKLSDKNNYNPTPYVSVTLTLIELESAAFIPVRKNEAA